MWRWLVVLLLVPACRRDQDPGSGAPGARGGLRVHPGGRTISAEGRFLDRMLEHQQSVSNLVRQAGTRDLTHRTLAILDRADWERLQLETELLATRKRYPGKVSAPHRLSPAGAADRLRGVQGDAYESAVVETLVADYREEVREIDSVLPILNADVKGLAKQIRVQRLREMNKLLPE